MSSDANDPKWPRLLGLAVHEIRTPLSTGLGFLGFLTRYDPPLTEQQLSFVTASRKAWGRISDLADEMDELAQFEAGKLALALELVQVSQAISEAVAALPESPDSAVLIDFSPGADTGVIQADATRLRKAFTSVLFALRREVVTSPMLFVRETRRAYNGRTVCWIAFGDADNIDRLSTATEDRLTTFNEWRGGCGLKPAVARRIIEAHGGAIFSPADGTKTGAVIALPR
ncbi:MAG: histidine kinase dimerization/phospho-acceptor domain-containing protein [Acidobacteriota bacterium]